jgi:hypothetical protein
MNYQAKKTERVFRKEVAGILFQTKDRTNKTAGRRTRAEYS